jgi:hypothetical protein
MSIPDQLGEAAFDHGPPACVAALKCFGFGFTPGRRKQLEVRMDGELAAVL